jgi:phage gp46-like protein
MSFDAALTSVLIQAHQLTDSSLFLRIRVSTSGKKSVITIKSQMLSCGQ